MATTGVAGDESTKRREGGGDDLDKHAYCRLKPLCRSGLRRRGFLGLAAVAGTSALGLVAPNAIGQPAVKRIYIAPDDHTDYFWTADEATYRRVFLETLDHYLGLMAQTDSWPTEYQCRWNCDCSLWLWEYERNRSRKQFQVLIQRIKSGHVSAPLNALVSCYGGAPTEAVIRSMYYSGRLERQYGLRFTLAVAMENQTLGLGIASLWAGSGARYSWRGTCGCASRTDSRDRVHEIYRMTGLDGASVLMKWHSMFRDYRSIGGYAEARDVGSVVGLVSHNADFLAGYPYDVIGAFGQGGDDLKTLVALDDPRKSFPAIAQSKTNASRQVIVSNEEDFFRDFERRYGRDLPSLAVTYGNEWDLYCASMAEVTARVRRAVEKLRAAEAMASLVCVRDPQFWSGRKAARERCWISLGKYWEHGWPADGPIGRVARANFQRRCARDIEAYVDKLHADALAALASLVPKPAAATRVMAFNTLGHERTEVADHAYAGEWPVRVFDLAAGAAVPAQLVRIDGRRHIRFLARDLPALGYKVYELRPGTPDPTPCATLSGEVFESSRYRLKLAGRGAISSLVDKTRGYREFARILGGRAINDLGSGSGSLAIENKGPVSTSVRITASGPLHHTTVVTLYDELDRVDIDNRITQNFSDVQTWHFGFNFDNPNTWCEEQGAILNARLSTDGGHYSPRNARYDWLSLNHFAAMSDGGATITLANADCCFARLGNSNPRLLDTDRPSLSVLAGGQVDGVGLGIRDQGGSSLFRQRFSLQTGSAYDPVASMRMALAFQNPIVTAAVNGRQSEPAGFDGHSFGLVQLSNPRVLLWAFKPSEEGIRGGLIARLWNLSSAERSTRLRVGSALTAAQLTTHLETNIAVLPLQGGELALSFKPQQLRTVRVRASVPLPT